MKRIGTVSYNIYCNFTNYGSALQTWALHQAIKKLGYIPVLVDYCPDILKDKDPLNPYKNMWDQNDEVMRMVELSFPTIRENYNKFDRFYHGRFTRTKDKYTRRNFSRIVGEGLDGFVCGSDTIFCPDEFGFDDGYYAHFPEMRNRAVAYAASFGDPEFTDSTFQILNERIRNFKALGIRENLMIEYLMKHTNVPVERVVDPTLLLQPEDYSGLTTPLDKREKGYLLLYSRRHNDKMDAFAEKIAKQNGWKIVEISLWAVNAEQGHIMRYDAGVEEFLDLVKNAEYVVTNSYHGAIFSIQFRRPFMAFSREQCNNKFKDLFRILDIDRLMVTGDESFSDIDYNAIHKTLEMERRKSMDFLSMALELL